MYYIPQATMISYFQADQGTVNKTAPSHIYLLPQLTIVVVLEVISMYTSKIERRMISGTVPTSPSPGPWVSDCRHSRWQPINFLSLVPSGPEVIGLFFPVGPRRRSGADVLDIRIQPGS